MSTRPNVLETLQLWSIASDRQQGVAAVDQQRFESRQETRRHLEANHLVAAGEGQVLQIRTTRQEASDLLSGDTYVVEMHSSEACQAAAPCS